MKQTVADLKKWWSHWSYFKRKEYIIWKETKRRGGALVRKAKRMNRLEEIRSTKEALYSDLESGWMLGDFRISLEHIELLRDGRGRMPLSELEQIYICYRTMQNESISRF